MIVNINIRPICDNKTLITLPNKIWNLYNVRILIYFIQCKCVCVWVSNESFYDYLKKLAQKDKDCKNNNKLNNNNNDNNNNNYNDNNNNNHHHNNNKNHKK